MKSFNKIWFTLMLLGCIQFSAVAQNSSQDLIKQGVELHNQGKYAEAVDKYNEVLKTDPGNGYANYEMAFSLYQLKKPKDAIPHLQKAITPGNPSLSVAAYSLLASIYDEDNQPQKAIETYNEAIKINPDYPQIFFNLGIVYFRNQQYQEAENSAIEAIKRNPKNASSQRLYALVTFHQNKRVNALLGLCSFILLEPMGPRATEAFGNIQHILQGGVLTDNKGKSTLTVPSKDDTENATLNLGISMALLSGQSKKLTDLDLLEYQLKTIFALTGQLSEKKTDKSFFDRFFVDYFYKLAQSNNMVAFTHTIAQTANKDESAKWNQENEQQINALTEWIKTTQRSF